ncbi:hypothetical protein, partial [Halolamina salina]
LVSGAVALGIGIAGAAAFLYLPPLWALVPIVALVALARAPVFRSGGRARLRTDDDPEGVRDAFAGPTPPPLALQWGVADDVRADDGGAAYDLSYLFGLRSVEMQVDSEVVENVTEPDRVELRVTVDGQPWGTYTAWIEPVEGGTGITVEVQSDRKFGLRRLPQHLVARRYRDDALAAQGYETVERSFSLSQ